MISAYLVNWFVKALLVTNQSENVHAIGIRTVKIPKNQFATSRNVFNARPTMTVQETMNIAHPPVPYVIIDQQFLLY